MADTAGITLSLSGGSRAKKRDAWEEPHLVLALECSRPGALSARYSLDGIDTVSLGRGKERVAQRRETADGVELRVRVPDRWMSSRHAQLTQSFGRWMLTDTDSKNGTVLNGAPMTRAELADGDLFELGHTLFRFRLVETRGAQATPDLDLAQDPGRGLGLVTLVPAFAANLDKLVQMAVSEISILLQGESGTGKEVLARAIHRESGRRGPFVAVNCGAIPANLVESELFGHRKGAFSGALDHRDGLVRTADGGTLFLDEIGDLPPTSQAALLRVLQEREVMPVGATKPIPIDLRVVAATHRDLKTLAASGSFRQDLFARLAGFRVTLPLLRDRTDDLGLLIGTFHDRVTSGADHPGFEVEAARCLFRYHWPLNIRELEQTLQTAAVLAGADEIAIEHLPDHVRTGIPVTVDTKPGQPALGPEDARRRDELLELLRRHQGNVSAIARDMGKDRKQIQRWLKRYRLKASAFRTG